MTPNDRSMSWFWVVLALILFWPVGLFLLFRKLSQDRSATMNMGGLVAVVSFFLMFLGMVYLSLMITSGAGYLVPMLLTGGGGIWLFRVSRNMKATGVRYKRYIDLVINQGMTSIDDIAAVVGVDYSMALTDLQKMIDGGYFRAAYIDASRRSIIVSATQAAPQMAQGMQPQAHDRVVTCNGCGANNRVMAHVSTCEYCGSPIS